MFKLEKVFQNDDSGYILFVNFLKSIFIFASIYIFSILKNNSIFDLNKTEIFINSKFFYYSIILSFLYFVIFFFLKNRLEYKLNFISFLREDILNLIVSNFFTLVLIFILNLNFDLNFDFFFVIILLILYLEYKKLYFNFLYKRLIEKNVIQKNVMLVGTYGEIKEVLKNDFDKIIIFKCCMLTDLAKQNIKLIRVNSNFLFFMRMRIFEQF